MKMPFVGCFPHLRPAERLGVPRAEDTVLPGTLLQRLHHGPGNGPHATGCRHRGDGHSSWSRCNGLNAPRAQGKHHHLPRGHLLAQEPPPRVRVKGQCRVSGNCCLWAGPSHHGTAFPTLPASATHEGCGVHLRPRQRRELISPPPQQPRANISPITAETDPLCPPHTQCGLRHLLNTRCIELCQ